MEFQFVFAHGAEEFHNIFSRARDAKILKFADFLNKIKENDV